jgi:hypothetical protein
MIPRAFLGKKGLGDFGFNFGKGVAGCGFLTLAVGQHP